mmetsp:Transcript_78025/g.187063  ORF Transcript_78025/g.187063 Transcript_78025/m.187063 type:complete len:203 (+) Transcript_78025:775-1383(+)
MSTDTKDWIPCCRCHCATFSEVQSSGAFSKSKDSAKSVKVPSREAKVSESTKVASIGSRPWSLRRSMACTSCWRYRSPASSCCWASARAAPLSSTCTWSCTRDFFVSSNSFELTASRSCARRAAARATSKAWFSSSSSSSSSTSSAFWPDSCRRLAGSRPSERCSSERKLPGAVPSRSCRSFSLTTISTRSLWASLRYFMGS